MTKRQKILLGLSPVLLYALYVLVGMGVFAAGWVREWAVAPNYVLTNNSHDLDSSRAGSDGPHVFYHSDSIVVKWVMRVDRGFEGKEEYFSAGQRDSIRIECRFDAHPDWNFSTRLKPVLVAESTTYPAQDSALAISDIEGEFGAFRTLLKNGVMNARCEWTFGSGHLILVGDFFDRGLNVTECLWLIYRLEGEAARQGGKVHFILGNHEVMNMQGDLRYVRNKYIENTHLIRENCKRWYTPQTELGRWLQTKNVAEKIGPLLAVYGGFSEEVSSLRASLDEIAQRCRVLYFDTIGDLTPRSDARTKTLASHEHGPFWYRGYVQKDASDAAVEKALKQYGAAHILVGHTVVPHVTKLYGGRVIALDTKHAEGISEGVFFRGGKFYRIDTTGVRIPL